MRVRLIAVDLDGTLLGADDRVSPGNLAALARARAAGLVVVPATGRPARLVWDIAETGGLGPLGVCSNGAAVVDLAARRVLREAGFPGPDAVGVVDAVRVAVPGIALGADRDGRFLHEPGLFDGLELPPRGGRTLVADMRPEVASGCLKFVARRPGLASVELVARLAGALGDSRATEVPGRGVEELGRPPVAGSTSMAEMTASDIAWVDIGPPGRTKASGLVDVCARLGVSMAEVAAIGDAYNDLPMLAAVGTPAAMGNAVPEVAALAGWVVPSNLADGVAVFIDAILDGTVPARD